MRRRYLHHAMFYGFMLCFAATSRAAFVYHTFPGMAGALSIRQRCRCCWVRSGGVLLLVVHVRRAFRR